MKKKDSSILIVEDDAFIAQAYQKGFTEAGYQVEVASDGKEGLEVMKASRPDLVFLDLIMPVKDGFEVLKAASKDEDLKTIPIVVLSNLGQESDIKLAKKLGAKDHLVKANYSMAQLLTMIKKYL